eukprot:3045118-Heterocapsa_arctica.AAC.1
MNNIVIRRMLISPWTRRARSNIALSPGDRHGAQHDDGFETVDNSSLRALGLNSQQLHLELQPFACTWGFSVDYSSGPPPDHRARSRTTMTTTLTAITQAGAANGSYNMSVSSSRICSDSS